MAVNVDVNNSSNLAAAQTAAENLARALAKLEAALNDLAPNTPIQWGDNQYTASQILSTIHNTKFIVSDRSDFGNSGVGMAAYGLNGQPNVNTLNFRYFDGDLGNSNGTDYAASTYTNDQGLLGILLHEIAHMTQAGYDFDQASKFYHRREFGNYNNFNSSDDYWNNNETFAFDFA